MILRVAPAVIYLSIVASDEYTYRLCTKWHGIDVRSHRPSGRGPKFCKSCQLLEIWKCVLSHLYRNIHVADASIGVCNFFLLGVDLYLEDGYAYCALAVSGLELAHISLQTHFAP